MRGPLGEMTWNDPLQTTLFAWWEFESFNINNFYYGLDNWQ